jgi:hypothetical protein
MRLTNYDREQICNAALNGAFKPRFEALALAEHDLAIAGYESVFPADVRKQAGKMPKGWLRLDACLSFNVGGFDMRLNVRGDGVPVPYDGGYCRRLGTITGDLADKIHAHFADVDKLKAERDTAKRALTAMLQSCSTLKRLQEEWPEGEPYWSALAAKANVPGLPAPRVQEINAMLGLTAAEAA